MKVRGVVVALAFLLAAGATAAVFAYVNGVKNENKSTTAGMVTVVVAKQEIPAGTKLDSLLANGTGFREIQVPSDAVVPGAITDPLQLQGQTTSATILQGEQIPTARLVGSSSLGGGRLGIPKGMEAVSLALDAQTVVNNQITTGDHVTIFGAFASGTTSATAPAAAQNQPIVTTVVPDALVLQGTETTNGTTSSIVTLALSPKDAARVIYTQHNATSWLTLLAPGEKGVRVPVIALPGVLKS